jgi:hypothetical protein
MASMTRRWILRCAAAEAVGMLAAAGAARVGQALVGEPGTAAEAATVVTVAVAGGLIEGLAVAVATGYGLRSAVPGLPLRRWIAVTTAVAGLGWAGGSLPASLSGASADGSQPPLALIAAGAAGIGVVMGALLGAAQALVLRGGVPHPARWVTASAIAWAPAMAVIFTGATIPDGSWTVAQVLVTGLVTGLVAGAVLGLLLSWGARACVGTTLFGELTLSFLTSGLRRLCPAGLIGLAVRGRRTGEWRRFPVMAAPAAAGDVLVVAAGHPDRKLWWRNLRGEGPQLVAVCVEGTWLTAKAELLWPDHDHDDYDAAAAIYRAGVRHGGEIVSERPPLVRLTRT